MCVSRNLPNEECHCAPTGFGKRQSREAVAPGNNNTNTSPHIRPVQAVQSGALSIKDQASGKSFLVDTGADVSVFPASQEDRRASAGTASAPALRAANGTKIRTFGTRDLCLEFPGIKLTHGFQLAEVNKPILLSLIHI